jgi:hypothetical protein
LITSKNYRDTHKESISKAKSKCYYAKKHEYNTKNKFNAERSYNSFISSLFSSVKKRTLSREYFKLNRKITRKVIQLAVTVDDIVNIYENQNGRCAISNIKMKHEFGKLESISIDRINSNEGYNIDNIQLICQFINLGKHNKSNNEVIDFLNNLKEKLCNA